MKVGVIAIGRNEGERLRRCLESVRGADRLVVYVDSGSTDGSVELARAQGVEVVALDMSLPFSAARARNAGFARLLEIEPGLDFVQFVDGDCEVAPGWIESAGQTLRKTHHLAVATGRRRERFPDRTIYNRLCDLEWDTPVGEAKACGGDAMIRVTAFRQVDGFRPDLIAGEEPELCVRLRASGWRILRIDAEMTIHDADMTRFRQWRKRATRAGHAYAEGAALHGRPPERHWVRETRSIWTWGFWLPLAAIGPAWITHGWSLLLLLAYLLLAWRITQHCRRRNLSLKETWLLTLFTILGKFPQLAGQLQYRFGKMLGRRTRLIEYKGSPS
jgi:GT2 family glycosyltransferase